MNPDLRTRWVQAGAGFVLGWAALAPVSLYAQDSADPWPTWQKTNSRIGRTATIGPQTPTVSWSLQVDFDPDDENIEARQTLDANGRLFTGVRGQVTCVDLRSRDILWEFQSIDPVYTAPYVLDGRVYFGTASGDDAEFYCVRADTGEEIWRFVINPGSINASPAIDEHGVIHFNDGWLGSTLYALRADDGSVVWTRNAGGEIISSPSLDGEGRLYHSNLDLGRYFAFDITDGSTLWEFPVNGYTQTTLPVENGRVYGGLYTNSCSPRRVYCLDSRTGERIWQANPCENVAQAIALGSPESKTLYAAPGGSAGVTYAFDTDDGSIKWTYVADLSFDPPIVDGLNNIYFGSFSLPLFLWAVRADGSELWKHPMPDKVFGAPILAPDGTLFVVCSDKYLYAFRDPAGDLNYDQRIDLADYAKFDTCMTDPRLWGTRVNTAPGCELLDFDRDWDVDLADYSQFQNQMGDRIP